MKILSALFYALIILALSGCDGPVPHDLEHSNEEADVSGIHNGRLLKDGQFSVEISIFETGVPPEYRVWAMAEGKTLDPSEVKLTISHKRLGGITDEINFDAQGDYLRGDMEIYEPHSFAVKVDATYENRKYEWSYDSFEGRTQITPRLASAAGIEVEPVGPATIRDYITVYGEIVSNPENVSHVVARFDGVIQSVDVSIGDQVKKGDVLVSVEANDSLNSYIVASPISGTVVERHANAGESTSGRSLLTIIDTRNVWAEFAVFPSDRPRLQLGAPIKIQTAIGEITTSGNIDLLSPITGPNQSVTARVKLDNPNDLLTAGMYLTGEIEVAKTQVPLAVRRAALQPIHRLVDLARACELRIHHQTEQRRR